MCRRDVRVAAIKNRGGIEEAVTQRRVLRSAAAAPQHGAFCQTSVHVGLDLVPWAAEISGPVSASGSNGPPSTIRSTRATTSSTNRSCNDCSTMRRAPAEHLPGMQEHGGEGGVHRSLEVRVGEDTVRVLAAEFECDPLDSFCGTGHYAGT